mmetsp:Transcript_115951/g.223585  ORF Transcript_115951/g.223585 Transcript_115951/m.223585 type:complete len:206 (+) Transcript_115951:1465-2082(+)
MYLKALCALNTGCRQQYIIKHVHDRFLFPAILLAIGQEKHMNVFHCCILTKQFVDCFESYLEVGFTGRQHLRVNCIQTLIRILLGKSFEDHCGLAVEDNQAENVLCPNLFGRLGFQKCSAGMEDSINAPALVSFHNLRLCLFPFCCLQTGRYVIEVSRDLHIISSHAETSIHNKYHMQDGSLDMYRLSSTLGSFIHSPCCTSFHA